MDKTSELMSQKFNQETNCLNRLFSRQLQSAAYSDEMKNQFINGMPDYMIKSVNNCCYDCCYIISLNEYLNRWRVYINNNNDLIGNIEDIRHKISQCKSIINNKFELIGDEKYWFLCGCSDLNKQIEEDVAYENYLEINQHDEEFEERHKKTMAWRTDFYKHLYDLDQHLHYFVKIPHKVYRDSILFELMTATNMDCVNKILEYL